MESKGKFVKIKNCAIINRNDSYDYDFLDIIFGILNRDSPTIQRQPSTVLEVLKAYKKYILKHQKTEIVCEGDKNFMQLLDLFIGILPESFVNDYGVIKPKLSATNNKILLRWHFSTTDIILTYEFLNKNTNILDTNPTCSLKIIIIPYNYYTNFSQAQSWGGNKSPLRRTPLRRRLSAIEYAKYKEWNKILLRTVRLIRQEMSFDEKYLFLETK